MSRPSLSAPLTLRQHGAQRFPGAVVRHLAELLTLLAETPAGRPGLRISAAGALSPILAPSGAVGTIAAVVLGPSSRPFRAILFDKTASTNWSLAWHQDRTISVRRRIEIAGFGPWTSKGGMHHVAPPFDLLTGMVTLRVHLDSVPEDNAPLLIAPGSHTAGRVAVDAIEAVVRRCGIAACLADAGDVWLYATPILHASDAAIHPKHRRVLQVDYAAVDLPGGLEWFGV